MLSPVAIQALERADHEMQSILEAQRQNLKGPSTLASLANLPAGM